MKQFVDRKLERNTLVIQEAERVSRNLFRDKMVECTRNEVLMNAAVDRWDTLFKVVAADGPDKIVVI